VKRIPAALCVGAVLVGGLVWRDTVGQVAAASAPHPGSAAALQRLIGRTPVHPGAYTHRPAIGQHRQTDAIVRAPAAQSVSSLKIDIAGWDPSQATVDADTVADNSYADNHYFRGNHSTSYAILGRTTGYYQEVDFADVLLAHYQGSIFSSSNAAAAAAQDAQNATRGLFWGPGGPGTAVDFTDCTSALGMPCMIMKYIFTANDVDFYEVYTTFQYNQCLGETTVTAPVDYANTDEGNNNIPDLGADIDVKGANALINTCGTSGAKPTIAVPTSPPATLRPSGGPSNPPPAKPTATSAPPTATPVPQPSIRIQGIQASQNGKTLNPPVLKSGVATTFQVNVQLSNPGNTNPTASLILPAGGGATTTNTMSRTALDATSAQFTYTATLHAKKTAHDSVSVHVTLGTASDDNSLPITIKPNCKKNKKGKKVCH
jgi:hypothetical protein